MVRRKSRRSSTPAAQRSAGSEATIVWGKDVEAGDYLKVPRVILARGRYPIEGLRGLKPRHLLLLLVLAGRKFKRSRIRAYWEELADDLEVSKDTVRKWAYELRDRGLLHIAQHRGRDPDDKRVGYRNERNSFDIAPFVRLVEQAHKMRRADRPLKGRREVDRES